MMAAPFEFKGVMPHPSKGQSSRWVAVYKRPGRTGAVRHVNVDRYGITRSEAVEYAAIMETPQS